MNQQRSRRYGLTVDTGARPISRNKPSPGGSNAKSPSTPKEIQDAINVIEEFNKPRSTRSSTSNSNPNSRQKRDDSDIKLAGSTSSVSISRDTNSNPGKWDNIEVTCEYTPKFFNLDPSPTTPKQSHFKSDENPFDESPVKESKQATRNTSSQSDHGSKFFPKHNALSLSPVKSKRKQKQKKQSSTSPKKQSSASRFSPRRLRQRRPANESARANTSSRKCEALQTNTLQQLDAYEPLLTLSTDNEIILASNSSSSSIKTTSQLQRLMQSPEELILRPRRNLKNDQSTPLNVVCNEDGFEVEEYSTLEEGRIYSNKSNVKWGFEGKELSSYNITLRKQNSVAIDESQSLDTNELGENGWHRLRGAWKHKNEDGKQQLDSSAAIHILQRSITACDEYDALCQERSCLLKELEALEKDRTCLEQIFNEIEKELGEDDAPQKSVCRDTSKNVLHWEYAEFKDNITLIESEERNSILKHLPRLWLEELGVMEDAMLNDDDSVRKKRNSIKRKPGKHTVDKFSKEIADKIRYERGNGFALLLGDVNAKNSLIGRSYMNSYDNGKGTDLLSMEGPAVLIPTGGIGVSYFGVIGSEQCETACSDDVPNSMGTSYFIKFDSGKSYCRGMLPTSLADRLKREARDQRSLRYLSTGPSSAYYVEFDNGECWWGTASSQSRGDDALHRLLLELDVHRIAFGDDSWVVVSKDGDLVWKNLPQGLHDVLTSRETVSAAAPCEVSLGIDGSYFVRFLDGTIDYMLPSFVAEVCERLEAKGLLIRNVSLNADTHDSLIRYSSKTVD